MKRLWYNLLSDNLIKEHFMSYKDFAADFRKDLIRDAVFLYGPEDYLIEWSLDQIIDKYVGEEWRNLDVKYLDGDKATAFDIMGEARAFSMFSEKRVIVVRNFLPVYRKTADNGNSDLLDFIKSGQSSAVVVFIVDSNHAEDINAYGKKLIKVCSSYELSRLERPDLRSFITKRIHNAGKIISKRDLEYMIDLSGYYNKVSVYDLTALAADISKLVKAAAGDDITSGLIDDLLMGEDDRFAFDLVDAVVRGDTGRALTIAETIIREEDGSMRITALLTKQFEIMYDALELSREGMSISQMAKKTGVNEYRFKKAYQAAGAYSLRRISDLLIDLYNIDRDIKRGDIDKDVALELFALTAARS